MKNGKCPNCDSSEIISNIPLSGGEGHPPYVQISEPEPPSRPFIWIPKWEQSHFTASICGACGYTEFYATNHKLMNEAHKKGFK